MTNLRASRLTRLAPPVGLLVLVAGMVAASCGGDGGRPPDFNGSDGDAGSPPLAGGSGGGENGSGGTSGSGGDMTGLSPLAELRTPQAGAVFDASVTATCSVRPGGSDEAVPLDLTTLQISIEDEEGESLRAVEPTPAEDDEYEGVIDVSPLPSGRYVLGCSVADENALLARSEVDILVDHGPGIEPISPVAEGFLARSGEHAFVVRIRPSELFDGDDEAALAEPPELDIDGKTFTLEPKDGESDVYEVASVDFEDTAIFPDPPPGATTVSVSAENERGIKSRLQYPIYIDGVGPTVRVSAPAGGTIIGSRAVFSFKASDDYSGVDWSTLVVEAKDTQIPFDPDSPRWSLSGDTAVLELDTTDYSVGTQMSVNVTVSDRAGNPSPDGGESTYFLDQRPPLLALDPPNIRIAKETDPGVFECSHSFDPVGDLAVNHGADTNNLALFRVMAWDETNSEAGQLILKYSGVDPNSLRLWLAPAGDLAVDTDGDDICDDISSSLLDIDTVEFEALGGKGNPYYGDGVGDLSEPEMAGICTYKETPDAAPPKRLCEEDSDMTYILTQTEAAKAAAIFATLVRTGPACTGDQQSISALVGDVEGWICAAVRGSDTAGNQGVSAPIAICVDNSEVPGTPACVGSGPAGAPSCTDGCTPRTFPAGGLIIEP